MTTTIGRRGFLLCGAGSAALGAAQPDGNTRDAHIRSRIYHEPARDIPIEGSSDVVVCGGGPAGVAAAVAAARTGAKTRIIEVNGCLGGIWTAGLLCWILDARNKPGFMQEILTELPIVDVKARNGGLAYQPEGMKLILDQLCADAGINIHLHERVVAAHQESGRLGLVVTESKSGRRAYAGKVFIDATGDGDLAALAGCGFDVGREEGDEAQPLSMIAVLAGLRIDELTPFVRGFAEKEHIRPKQRLFEEMARAGTEPSYAHPTMFYLNDGLFALMANHEYGVAAADADAISQATIRSRAEVHELVTKLKALGGPWRDVCIVATAEHIGVREGRRIHGRYTITTEDIVAGRRYDDAVCRCTFGIDVHSTDPAKNKAVMKERVRSKPYDIPFRSLVARDVDGLLLAGRCISGGFLPHSSYRVTGNSVATGEAVGVAAALAASKGCLPSGLEWPVIAEALDDFRKRAESQKG